MEAYKKYKNSGVDWIGKIPEHWEVKKLKYVAGINPTKRNYEFTKDSTDEVVFLPMERVSEDGIIDQSLRKPICDVCSGFTYFEQGDVITAKITPCFENGKGALLTNLETPFGFGSTEFHTLRAGNTFDRSFLFHVSKSAFFRGIGEAFMTGSAGQKRVSTDFVENFILGIPPLSEQRSIAAYLDRKCSEIDELIARKRRLLELLREERAAVINRAVTRGLDPKVKLKDSGIDWLGKIPKHWEAKKLKHVCHMKSGENITSLDFSDEGVYPVYGGNGVRGYADKFSHDGNYIIVGRQGALCGNVHYTSGKIWASEHAVVCTPETNYQREWLGELLRTMNLNQYSMTAAQPGLSVEFVKNLFVPVPPYAEQNKIVSHINDAASNIDTLVSRMEREIDLLQEYRTALIGEVVTGKICVCTK